MQRIEIIRHSELTTTDLRNKIRHKEIVLAGNRKLKIYGNLSCKSGKRMHRENRVFFASESDAIKEGYRPCGHCLRTNYTHWKNGIV